MMTAVVAAAAAPLHVLVVGGGPAGLVASIVARHAGAHVVVLEKRLNYTRNVFFDLATAPWGHALDVLRAWGLEAGVPELFWHADGSIATVRCCVLEQWLASLAIAQVKRVRLRDMFCADAPVRVCAGRGAAPRCPV